MSNRPADIVSPTKDKMLPPKTSPDDARRASRFVYDKPTPDNSITPRRSTSGTSTG